MRSEYSWLPPSGEPTRTDALQVGVSFSRHRALVYESASRTVEADVAGGSVIVTGRDPITWLRVHETTEALEIYPDLELLGSLGTSSLEPTLPGPDATVLGIASILKRVHLTGPALSDVAASALAHTLARHLHENYSGTRSVARPPIGRLDRGTVDRVAAFVEAELSGVLTLDRLAAVATLSPFYFARAFKSTTGLAPHQFVTSRRMHRATSLLMQTNSSVEQVAYAVGLSNLSHFRRLFRTHFGVTPGAYAKTARSDPPLPASARPALRCDSETLPDSQW
jgi:AraC family transcriptional regulator